MGVIRIEMSTNGGRTWTPLTIGSRSVVAFNLLRRDEWIDGAGNTYRRISEESHHPAEGQVE